MLICQRSYFKQRVENLAVATSPSASCRQVPSTLLRFTLQPLPKEKVGWRALRRRGNQVCNRLAVLGYGNGLSMFDRPEEFGQAGLGLRSLNLTRIDSSLCVDRTTLPIVPYPGQQRMWGAGVHRPLTQDPAPFSGARDKNNGFVICFTLIRGYQLQYLWLLVIYVTILTNSFTYWYNWIKWGVY